MDDPQDVKPDDWDETQPELIKVCVCVCVFFPPLIVIILSVALSLSLCLSIRCLNLDVVFLFHGTGCHSTQA